jgi:hypothetical protein
MFISIVLFRLLLLSDLSAAVETAFPDSFRKSSALEHVIVAMEVATPDTSAELLLGMASVESSYKRTAVSAPVKDCDAYAKRTGKKCYHGRRLGDWTSDRPGADWIPAGTIYYVENKKTGAMEKKVASYYCGVTQSRALTWKRCLQLRDLKTSYASTVIELSRWRKHCNHNERCMLLGYGGGVKAIRRGTLSYPAKVLRRTNCIRTATKCPKRSKSKKVVSTT